MPCETYRIPKNTHTCTSTVKMMIEYSLVNFDENAVCNPRDLQNVALFTELKNSVHALRHGYHLTKKYEIFYF